MDKKLFFYTLLCATMFSLPFYPYPFNYGLTEQDVSLEHKVLLWQNESIAWNVSEFNVGADGYINKLVIEEEYGYRAYYFNRSEGHIEINSTYEQEWFIKSVNQDDKKLALTVEWTVNMQQHNQACIAENKNSFWFVRSNMPIFYDWLIERSLTVHNPLYNGAKWDYAGNSTWKIRKVS